MLWLKYKFSVLIIIGKSDNRLIFKSKSVLVFKT